MPSNHAQFMAFFAVYVSLLVVFEYVGPCREVCRGWEWQCARVERAAHVPLAQCMLERMLTVLALCAHGL